MIGWWRCAVPGVRLFRIICGKLLRSNWALKMNRVKRFHHWFWFSVQDRQRELRSENKHSAEDRTSPQQWLTVWNSSSMSDFKLSSYYLLVVLFSGVMGQSDSKKVDCFTLQTFFFFLNKKVALQENRVQMRCKRFKERERWWVFSSFVHLFDIRSMKTEAIHSDRRKDGVELLCSCSSDDDAWPWRMMCAVTHTHCHVYGGSVGFGLDVTAHHQMFIYPLHLYQRNSHFADRLDSSSSLTFLRFHTEEPRADEVSEESAQF